MSPAAEVNEEETLEAPRPLKRLRDLDWPEEPDASFWNDPLKRDELKPLRNFELEAVGVCLMLQLFGFFPTDCLTVHTSLSAKSTELRKLMQENPTLPALLQQTFSDPSMPPTVFLRHIMGISTASTSASAPQNYRGRGRGRGMRGQHNRGRGRGGGPMRPAEAAPPPSPETVQLMHKFADLIKSILSEARQQKPA